MTATVDIYLPIESTSEWIHILTIPHADINRLTYRPLKWLRFAIFTVCGAKGHLSTTPGGEVADYDNISLENLEQKYYYIPDGVYHPVDYQAMDDRDTDIISASSFSSRDDFYKAVQDRDRGCVFTGDKGAAAAHIIPASKGDAYITFVVRDRFGLYERLPFSRDGNVNIDSVENGMLLRQDLHSKFGRADIAFLKTPNFAMVPADVRSFERGSTSDRTTLQWMIDPATLGGIRSPVYQWDALPDWRNLAHPPPSILLDYMYGAAVVKRWKSDYLLDMLEKWLEHTFSSLLVEEQKFPGVNHRDPCPNGEQNRGKKPLQGTSEALRETMDQFLFLPTVLKGVTPQSMIALWEKRREEVEQRSQQRRREKVQQWLGYADMSCTE